MSDEILMHIIYLESQVLLSKKRFQGWREIQDQYADYKTSLGPWTIEETLDFLRTEYPTGSPFTKEQIERFLNSNDDTIAN